MTFQIISRDTLKRLLHSDDILLLDLRSRDDYDKTHIPGAVWMNWETAADDIEGLWEDFARNHDCPPAWIVLYCDSGHISLLTARDLATRGYPVMSLNGGFHQWHEDL